MGICFVMFGVTSINLFFLLKANISLALKRDDLRDQLMPFLRSLLDG